MANEKIATAKPHQQLLAWSMYVLYQADACMPFPPKVVAHDLWVSYYAQKHFKCGYLDEVLQLYRRHENTVSFTGGKSTNSLYFKISYRAYLAWHLLWA